MNENPTTAGLDGGDNAGWHDEQHEIHGGMLLAVAILVSAALLLVALLAVR